MEDDLWYLNEPKNCGGNEDCVVSNYVVPNGVLGNGFIQSNGSLGNKKCSERRAFVCQKDMRGKGMLDPCH